MRTLFFVACISVAFSPLHAINFFVNDTTNQYFLNTSLSLIVSLLDENKNPTNSVTIEDGTAVLNGLSVFNRSVAYNFIVRQSTPSFVTWNHFFIEAQKSADNARRYIEEFEVSATFNSHALPGNRSDVPLAFVVSPPRFPHFQVKTDWQYRCPVNLILLMCPAVPGSSPAACDVSDSFKNVSMMLGLDNTVFNGGKPYGHDYSSKMEDCPKAYESRKDIGIGCIVAFWSIAIAVTLWFVIKSIIKRSKNKDY